MPVDTTGTSRGRVYMDLQPGDSLSFGQTGVTVEVVAKSGRAARLCITLPREVRIEREHGVDVRSKHAMISATERG
jgi:sRNA-binding carbon storage regulator CsrA